MDLSRTSACICFNMRKTTRAITQFFDQTLKPSGLRATQFTLLSAIAGQQPVTVGALADYLVMERTTVTHNLKPLEKQGFVETQSGQDKRTREIQLTQQGRYILEKALPLWEQAQQHFEESLGDEKFQTLLNDLELAVATALEKGPKGEKE